MRHITLGQLWYVITVQSWWSQMTCCHNDTVCHKKYAHIVYLILFCCYLVEVNTTNFFHNCFTGTGAIISLWYNTDSWVWINCNVPKFIELNWIAFRMRVNSLWHNDAIWWHRSVSALSKVMAGCHWFPEPMLTYHQFCAIHLKAREHSKTKPSTYFMGYTGYHMSGWKTTLNSLNQTFHPNKHPSIVLSKCFLYTFLWKQLQKTSCALTTIAWIK